MKLMRVYHQPHHNILGFRRIRQIHTFKLPPNHQRGMIKDHRLFLRHRQQ